MVLLARKAWRPKCLAPFFHEELIPRRQLFAGEAIFGVCGKVHDGVSDGEGAAGIIAAADSFGNPGQPVQRFDIRKVVQIDGGMDFMSQKEILFRRGVGRKHDFTSHISKALQIRILHFLFCRAFLI